MPTVGNFPFQYQLYQFLGRRRHILETLSEVISILRYIRIPRGLRDTLLTKCKAAGIEYDIVDHREKGRPIRVSFNGDLRIGQDLAADRMLSYDHGVLSATTAFGKKKTD
jgi:hypothetical protein